MNIRKIGLVLLITLLIINIVFLPCSYAKTISDIFAAGDSFLSSGEEPDTVMNKNKLKSVSTTIYKVLLSIAICVSVIIGAVLGIQFILGSVEGKVKVQEALVPYIVGCFVVFGAFSIWSIAINIGNNINGEKTLEQTAMDISRRNDEIKEGKVDLMTVDEDDLKQRYNENRIYDTLSQKVAGDSRGGGNTKIEEAAKQLGTESYKIWEACRNRKFLEDDGFTLK